MKHVNMAVLLGNVGNDPEVRSTQGGARVATFSFATSEEWNDGGGQRQKKTQWHRCVAWQGLAEVIEKYVGKGDTLHVIGKIEYRQWQDKDGQTRYSTEINVRELAIVRSKNYNGGGAAAGRGEAFEPSESGEEYDTSFYPDEHEQQPPAERAGDAGRAPAGRTSGASAPRKTPAAAGRTSAAKQASGAKGTTRGRK